MFDGNQYRDNTKDTLGQINGRTNESYERGNEEDEQVWLRRIEAVVYQLEAISATHIRWRTHKNPYGCWICELLQVARILGNNYSSRIGKDKLQGKRKRKN